MASKPTVMAIASSLGIGPLDPQVVDYIARDGDDFLLKVVELSNRIRKHKHCTDLRARDINDALRSKKQQIVYGYEGREISDYQQIGISDNYSIFANRDPLIKLTDVLSQPLHPYPVDTNYSFHWLSFKGAQPIIPENQPPLDLTTDFRISDSLSGPPPQLHYPDQSVNMISSTLQIPRELQAFFYQTLQRLSLNESHYVLQQLSNDQAIQPIVPFYIRWIKENISVCMNSKPEYLTLFLNFTRALFRNKYIDTELFTQNFLSIAMTLMLSPNFSENQTNDSVYLRESGADFLAEVLQKSRDSSPNLAQRIADQLSALIFDTSANPNSQYGAALGLISFGPELLRRILLPNLLSCLEGIEAIITNPAEKATKRGQYIRLKTALKRLCAICFHSDTMKTGKNLPTIDDELAEIYNQVMPFFGNDFLCFAHKP